MGKKKVNRRKSPKIKFPKLLKDIKEGKYSEVSTTPRPIIYISSKV